MQPNPSVPVAQAAAANAAPAPQTTDPSPHPAPDAPPAAEPLTPPNYTEFMQLLIGMKMESINCLRAAVARKRDSKGIPSRRATIAASQFLAHLRYEERALNRQRELSERYASTQQDPPPPH